MTWPPQRLLVASALAALLPVGRLPAQERGTPTRVYLALGPAAAGSTRDGGIGLVGQLVWEKGTHRVTLRGMGAASPFDETSDPVGELGILYGRTRSSTWGHLGAAAGIAVTDPGGCDPGEDCTTSTVGVPLVLEAALEPSRLFGLGVQLFGNINPEAFLGGLGLLLQLGWMP